MKYKNATQRTRKRFLQQRRLSETEKAIIEKDFGGKDYDFYKATKDSVLLLAEQYSAGATYRKIEPSVRRGAVRRRALLKYAAAIVLLLVAAVGVYRLNRAPEKILVSTSYGERKQLRLPDGSTVILNSLSAVSYPGNLHRGHLREIELNGEAYFDVAKDARRPFVVKASGIEVRVLGTKFDVSAYDDDEHIMTSLYEGSVSVTFGTAGDSILLKPGERAEYNRASGKTELPAGVAEHQSAWIKGSMYFENVQVKDIFKILEREKNISFLVSDEVNKDFRITAKFDHSESVDEILEYLSQPGGFTFEKDENRYIIKKQKH
ncbi:MAG: FecR domain-containing protein [Tannerella sp.]|jgi:ferric-dicitrate binding protein FerR (iron transport regulator)|nr:FecR domain-containing protein [Tannerella sp.]